MHLPIFIITTFFILNVSSLVHEKCRLDNLSFNRADVINVLLNISSYEQCLTACRKNSEQEHCHKFTWNTAYHEYYPNSCILFGDFMSSNSEIAPCEYCISGFKSCFCNNPTACLATKGGENVLDIRIGVDQETKCESYCNNYAGCRHYTWYTDGHWNQKFCILLSSCNSVNSQCTDCCSGSRTEEDFCSPSNHKELRSAERRITFEEEEGRTRFDCDRLDVDTEKYRTRSDWAGRGWYRVTGDAGTRLAKRVPRNRRCGSLFPFWLTSAEPEKRMGVQPGSICGGHGPLSKNPSPKTWGCVVSLPINIQNCGDFMIYELAEQDSKNYGYCTE